jgi:hypothetical protein
MSVLIDTADYMEVPVVALNPGLFMRKYKYQTT